ncbi:MAG: hypothetical protein WBN17_06425 [Aureibaculum sp.]
MKASVIGIKSTYLHSASWDELYTITKHWQSENDFYNYEITFLKKLIDKYFIWMTKKENIAQVRKLVIQLGKLEHEHKDIGKAILKHLNHITEYLENAFSHDEQLFRFEHSVLLQRKDEFTNEFRKIKKEVFEISEEVLDHKKLQLLLEKN